MRKVNKFKTLSIVIAIVAMTAGPSLLMASVDNPKSPLQVRTVEKKEMISHNDKSHLTPLKKFEGNCSFVNRETGKTPVKAPKAKMCNYTVVVTFDEHQYTPQGGGLINKEYVDNVWGLDENGTFSSSVPSGKYSVIFSFQKRNEIGMPVGTVFVIQDNVMVEGEETTISINPEEATRHLHFMPAISNGDEVKLSQVRNIYDSASGDIETEVLQEGNTDFITFTTGLWSNNLGPVFSAFGAAAEEAEWITDGGAPEYNAAPTDVWITDISEEWMITMNAVYGTGETLYYTMLSPENNQNGNVANNNDNFSEFIYPNFQQSYWGSCQEHQPDMVIQPYILPDLEGQLLPSPNQPTLQHFLKQYGSLYNRLRFNETSNESIRSKIKTFIRFETNDAVIAYSVDTIWWDDENYQLAISEWYSVSATTPFYLSDGKTRMTYNMEDTYFYNISDSEYDLYNRCCHPWLPTVEEMPYLVYSSTPRYFMSFFSGNHNRYMKGLGMYTMPADFYGAQNTTYLLEGEWEVEYNGEKLDIDTSQFMFMYEWAWMRDQENADPGEYRVTFITPEDRVGGLKSNTTFIACFDQRKADCTAPAIQLLNFVDSDNNFSHEFATPEDGMLRFVGGDFDWDNNINMPYSKECDIVVEVAPYSTDNWKKLTANRVEVEAPKYFAPAYEAPLKDVTAASETGWFDLRITMTDADGNYMTQTIAPAFKIDSLTGIDSTYETVSDVRIDGRNIIAPENARIFSINGTPVNGTNLQPGIYLVALSGHTQKVVIK